MKKKAILIFVVIVMVSLLIPILSVSAETTYYEWDGTGIRGYGNTMKFDMTEGFNSYCVDRNTYIKENISYIAKELEDYFDTAKSEKLRAILNYSWDKTSKVEITGIQYALWYVMHGTSIPGSLSGVSTSTYNQIKAVYDALLALPGIPASDASINNILTLTLVSPTPQTLGGAPADYSFNFNATSSTGAAIVFEVYDSSSNLLSDSDYSIVDNGSGSYTLILKNIADPSCYKLKAITLKNKAVNAKVFVSGYFNSEKQFIEDPSKSQTVVGIKLSSTTQSDDFTVCFEDPQPTTTTETTTEATTTEPLESSATETTTEATTTETTTEATTTETTTEATTTETTTEATTTEPLESSATETTTEATTTEGTTSETLTTLTTESIPLTSVTTTEPVESTVTESTTETMITLTTEEIPQTGESGSGNGLAIGLVLMVAAGCLTFVVYRRKPEESK